MESQPNRPLQAHRPEFVRRPSADVETSEPFNLAPPDGLSEKELFLETQTLPPISDAIDRPPQFSIRSLLLLTFFVAVGVSAPTLAVVDTHAFNLGIAVCILIVCCRFKLPESPLLRTIYIGAFFAYFVSILRATIQVVME